MTGDGRSDREDLAVRYDHVLAEHHRARWSLENRGNRAAAAERLSALTRLTAGNIPRSPTVLDLGCGAASMLPQRLLEGAVVGVDLLMSRLLEVAGSDTTAVVVNADGAQLSFGSETFDAVVMSTMLSSVADSAARTAIAGEVWRVLKPGGGLIWYDFRYPSLSSPTSPVRKSELIDLFGGLVGSIESITLLPPLARHLGRWTDRLYPALARVPALRSHLIAYLVKPRQ